MRPVWGSANEPKGQRNQMVLLVGDDHSSPLLRALLCQPHRYSTAVAQFAGVLDVAWALNAL